MQYIKRAINRAVNYEELPPKVRAALPASDYRVKYALCDKLCSAPDCLSLLAAPLCKMPAEHARCCRAKELCIQKGFRWGEGLSASSCSEHEYYEDLLRMFRHSMRVRFCQSLA